jgi:pimeloyl-ACP methyl ester carboxylesterase
MMGAVTSADGTVVAFDQVGAGPPLIMVVGAFNTRATTAPLAAALQERFTVFNYDRRGRGDSGDAPSYSVGREIDDLEAVIAQAGGSAAVFGYSSGANLALQAVARGAAISELVLYEPPFVVGDRWPRPPADLAEQIAGLIAAGRRGDAVELFQTKAVGMPEEVVTQMRHAPFRPALEEIAHTLVYDATIIGDLSLPTELLASIHTPSLVIEGEKSAPLMREAARAVADTLPNGRRSTIADAAHEISPRATAAVLEEFLSS